MDEISLAERVKRSTYKAVCSKLGFIMCIFFICKLLSYFVAYLLSHLTEEIGETAVFISYGIISVMLVYMVPLLVAAILFKSFDYYNGKIGELYKKPERLAKKLGTFPAMYGLGYGVMLLTLLARYIIEKTAKLEEFLQPTTVQASSNIAYLIMTVFLLVVIAPVFEELLCRGIMYDALKPYGNGAAIVITAVLFGLMHGSLFMLFYTTALGLALGYIRYATNSLFVVTVLHAIFNAVAAGTLVVLSLMEMTNEQNKLINTAGNIYLLASFILVIVGIIAFLRRIPIIRKYKIENIWKEISGKKKIALFFVSVPVLIMLVFAFDEHANNMIVYKIIGLF